MPIDDSSRLTPHASRLPRDHARQIWQAGLDAVRADKLVERNVLVRGRQLIIAGELIDLDHIGRIVVVGAGKAGASMAAGLESALGADLLKEKSVTGWINVPENCVRSLSTIHLHAARPAGVNEPRPEGVAGAVKILNLVENLDENDLCICLISGGGSALLPAPIPGVSLEDKLAVTRRLSAAGANIAELNTVRKQLSRIKGGGLARACRAGRLISLIISDVLGDPLDVIASGPTVENQTTAVDALAVLDRYAAADPWPPAVIVALRSQSQTSPTPPRCRVNNHVIGNNALAVHAAGIEAERLGYTHAMHSATELEGEAEAVGKHLAGMARHMAGGNLNCLITGGEPVVRLVEESRRGKGGRNQQLVLAAMIELMPEFPPNCVILSAGTDGEDGPTDAAGALVDAQISQEAARLNLNPADHLARNDAYTFFEQSGGLLKTGPTHTNVCDLRVMLIRQP